MSMKAGWYHWAPLVFCITMLAGCATSPSPLEGLIAGRQMETLQSDISISLRQGKETRGARGYLLYQRPDQFHLALLSPFGQSLLEVYSRGDTFTYVFPGEKIAYTGTIRDLPEQQGARLWGLMQWVVDRPPLDSQREGERELLTPMGKKEKVTYDGRGLIVRRVSEEGDEVDYADYRSIDGLAFPLLVELRDIHDNQIRLKFDEPIINRPLEQEILNPHLDKLQVFPLAYFRGF